MDILLSHGYFLEDDIKEQEIMKPYPPLGILYISSWLKLHKIDCQIFDTTFSSKTAFKDFLVLNKPAIVAFYVNLMTKLNILEIIQFIKSEPTLVNTKIILGGPEVTHSKERFLKYGADFIVIGEGEETVLELVRTIHHKTIDFESLSVVSGISFLDKNNGIYSTQEREKLKDLDQLPIPDREAIDLQLYLDTWKKHHGQNSVSISTMRGCPYTCKWCSRAVYGLSYRRRSPEKVVEEILHIKNTYQPDALWFVDDVFTISHKWLSNFADLLVERDAIVPFECITRADRLNEEVIRILKKAGCFRVWIGAESGSQRIIDAMDRRVKVGQVRAMIQMAKKYGIQAGTFIMLGYPGETETDIEETIHHLQISDPDFYTITLAYPIKGTEMFQEIENDFTNDLDWETSTDRQIEFKRNYSKRFYKFALKRVNNEVAFSKLLKNPWHQPIQILKHKAKSEIAKLMMLLDRLRA